MERRTTLRLGDKDAKTCALQHRTVDSSRALQGKRVLEKLSERPFREKRHVSDGEEAEHLGEKQQVFYGRWWRRRIEKQKRTLPEEVSFRERERERADALEAVRKRESETIGRAEQNFKKTESRKVWRGRRAREGFLLFVCHKKRYEGTGGARFWEDSRGRKPRENEEVLSSAVLEMRLVRIPERERKR